MSPDTARGELLVKQTYWDYDDFMNTSIRNPTKKCYYEMMSRDEFNIRQDLCKDLEVKRNNIIEKIGSDVYAPPTQHTEDNLTPYGVPETTNERQSNSASQQIPELEHQLFPSLIQQHPPPVAPPRTPLQTRPVEGETREQRQPNDSPRPRCVPYHMRSPHAMSLHPRPGPGVAANAQMVSPPSSPPPNEASNIYYLDKLHESRMKPPPHSQTSTNPSTATVQQPNEPYGTISHPQSAHNEKLYKGPNVRSKSIRQSPSSWQPAFNGQMHPSAHYTPLPPNIQRYQYPQTIPQSPLSSPYESNNQGGGKPVKYPPKSLCGSLQCGCTSSCSCSLKDKNTKPQRKVNSRQSGALRPDTVGQFRATSLDSMSPSPLPLSHPQAQYYSKPELAVEKKQMSQQCPPLFGPRQAFNNQPALELQYEENARKLYAPSPNAKHPFAHTNITNLKPRRPNHPRPPTQNYNYNRLPQANNDLQATKAQGLQPIVSQHPSGMQSHSVNDALPPHSQRPYNSESAPSTVIDHIQNDANGVQQNEGYEGYNVDYHRRSTNSKQLYVRMAPPKARNEQNYNWPTSQGVAQSQWHGDYGYSDTDNCDLEEEEEDDDDNDNSW